MWLDDNWFESGIENTFEIEMVEPTSLTSSKGYMDGFLGGSLIFGYETVHRVTGYIDISDANYIPNSLIRIWHIARLGSDEIRHPLATCFVVGEDLEKRFGRSSGKLELQSTLVRFEDDLLTADLPLNQGTLARTWFNFLVEGAWGECKIHSSIQNPAFNQSHIFEFKEKNRARLQYAADFLNAKIGVDPLGYITLTPYTAPSKRALTFDIPTGEKSIVLVGVPIEENYHDMYNRFSIQYQPSGGEPIYGTTALSPTHIASVTKQGRWKTYAERISDMDPETPARAQEIAEQRRDETAFIRRHEAQMFYFPLDAVDGQVGIFRYRDTENDEGIEAVNMVYQVTLDLDYKMLQKVIFKEVAQ